MDKFMTGFVGFVFGAVTIIIFLSFVPGYTQRNLEQCRDAQLVGLPIVWQKEAPFCSIDIVINDKTKTVSLSEYYEYTK
jgi:hypothetical protein